MAGALRGCFDGIYAGRRVLVTGHTGFKGSWLSLWLRELGAEVYGYSLPPPTSPSHWDVVELDVQSELGDVRDTAHLRAFVARVEPEIVFHLAAQPLVRESYAAPLETYATNVMGSLNLYEACRAAAGVRAIVAVTTDKVYENKEWVWGYRENDPLGGHDPYSASKACAELASSSYRLSYWPPERYGEAHRTLLAVARAGNVIGGGDWAAERLLPDVMRGAAAGEEAIIRNPRSTRPWEHVLEPLSGYLLLGQRLLEGRREIAQSFNFGPAEDGLLTVEEVVRRVAAEWARIRVRVEPANGAVHEAGRLMLDCARARALLGWRPVWDGGACFRQTVRWYRAYYEDRRSLSREQLGQYVEDARQLGLAWAGRGSRP